MKKLTKTQITKVKELQNYLKSEMSCKWDPQHREMRNYTYIENMLKYDGQTEINKIHSVEIDGEEIVFTGEKFASTSEVKVRVGADQVNKMIRMIVGSDFVAKFWFSGVRTNKEIEDWAKTNMTIAAWIRNRNN